MRPGGPRRPRPRTREFPAWGRQLERGIAWEALTATTFLQSGADILVMRHPKAVELVRNHIDELMKE